MAFQIGINLYKRTAVKCLIPLETVKCMIKRQRCGLNNTISDTMTITPIDNSTIITLKSMDSLRPHPRPPPPSPSPPRSTPMESTIQISNRIGNARPPVSRTYEYATARPWQQDAAASSMVSNSTASNIPRYKNAGNQSGGRQQSDSDYHGSASNRDNLDRVPVNARHDQPSYVQL